MSDGYNAADRHHVRAAAKQAKIDESQRLEIIRGIMSLPAGRAWMLGHLETCHIFASSHTRNALDTAFAEGERNVGLRFLLDIMQACPEQYTVMMQERNARNISMELTRDRRTDDEYFTSGTRPGHGGDEAGPESD